MALTFLQYWLLIITLSWIGAWIVRPWTPKWDWTQHVGLALVLYPFVRMAVGVALTFHLLGQYTVLEPYAYLELWRKVLRHTLHYLVVPGLGLLLATKRLPLLHQPLRDTPAAVASALRKVHLRLVQPPKRELLHGLALFLPLLLAYLAAMMSLLLFLQDLLVTGDESQLWANLTIPLILALSIVAAVTEEWLFRGLLQRTLARAVPVPGAILLQAVFFGFTHTGYGTWAHVLGPVLFGLAAGWVTHRLGLLTAMALHAEVNILFFSVDPAVVAHVPQALALPALLLAANAVAAWHTGLTPYRRLLQRDPPAGATS